MRAGSLVECVEVFVPNIVDIRVGNVMPVVGNIYTIREIVPHFKVADLYYILLEEIVNSKSKYINGDTELSFLITGFREIQPPMELTFVQEIQHKREMADMGLNMSWY